MFKFFKQQKSAEKPDPSYRTMTEKDRPGQEWQDLAADFAALAAKISADMIVVAQESSEREQLVALFSQPDLFIEDFESLTLLPNVLLIKTSRDDTWHQADSKAEITIPKALLRCPKRNTWEIRQNGGLRRGHIFVQARHLVAAPFRRFL